MNGITAELHQPPPVEATVTITMSLTHAKMLKKMTDSLDEDDISELWDKNAVPWERPERQVVWEVLVGLFDALGNVAGGE